MNLNKNNILGEICAKLSVLAGIALLLYVLSLYIKAAG